MPANRLRVLHVVEAVNAGVARHVLSILRNADPEVIQSEVACPAVRQDSTDTQFVRDIEALGIPWRPVAMQRSIDVIGDTKALMQLTLLICRERYDVVHTHSSKAGVLGRLAARLCGVPSVYTPNGLYFLGLPPGPKRMFYGRLERIAARWGNAIVAVSESERDALIEARVAPATEIETIPNGVTSDEVDPATIQRMRGDVRRELRIADGSFVVGTAARLAPQKDPSTLVLAMRSLVDAFPDATLVWCGDDGGLRTQIDHMVAELKLERNVRLLGFRNDVPRLMRAWDAFSLTSLYEGLPYALLDAMALGLPSVVTNVVGMRELVHDGETGRIVQPGDYRGVALSLIHLATHPDVAKACGRRARALVSERYNERTMVEHLLRLYSGIA